MISRGLGTRRLMTPGLTAAFSAPLRLLFIAVSMGGPEPNGGQRIQGKHRNPPSDKRGGVRRDLPTSRAAYPRTTDFALPYSYSRRVPYRPTYATSLAISVALSLSIFNFSLDPFHLRRQSHRLTGCQTKTRRLSHPTLAADACVEAVCRVRQAGTPALGRGSSYRAAAAAFAAPPIC